MMLYWLENTLRVLPALALVFFAVGLPWSLALLPRRDWRNRPLVACLLLLLGPALLSVWMFVLGTWGAGAKAATMTAPNILIGIVGLAISGALLVMVRIRRAVPAPTATAPLPLRRDERILLVMMGAAFVLLWLTAAYWPFIHYDPLWVYGYQGRLYTLNGFIPNEIGYYPQFLQMQYAFGQIISGGGLDDHAARAIVPFLHLASVLSAYLLGERLFDRRVGLFTAALWMLYPHVGEWSSVGDLEIPLTAVFTAAAAFFLRAWMATTQSERLHNALLAGVLLGIAMWTKPTAGALIWGVVLLVAVEWVRLRGSWRAFTPRFQVAMVTGLACIPLGALWYARNIALGHPPLTLPHDFWLTQAMRSGVEFGWPLLALFTLNTFLTFAPLPHRPPVRQVWLFSAVMLAALLPTIIAPRRMNIAEWLILGLGIIGYLAVLSPYVVRYATVQAKRHIAMMSWALLLALPYFITWFYSYSYHYRLSFPIVPLMILPTALILAKWVRRDWVVHWPPARQRLYHLALLVACLPGVFVVLPRYNAGWDWLWSNRFPDDMSRLATFNGAIAEAAQTLIALAEHEGDIVILAPGFQRLPFFLPHLEVRIDDTPLSLAEIADVDYLIFTQETAWLYAERELPAANQVLGSMARAEVMTSVNREVDASFYVLIHRLRPPQQRFRARGTSDEIAPDNVTFGDFGRLASVSRSDNVLSADRPIRLRLVWEARKPSEVDYVVYLHLYDERGDLVQTWDAPPAQFAVTYTPTPWLTHYATQVWEAGEFIQDRRILRPDPKVQLDASARYRLVVGFYDPLTLARVPVSISGDPAGDGYTLYDDIVVGSSSGE